MWKDGEELQWFVQVPGVSFASLFPQHDVNLFLDPFLVVRGIAVVLRPKTVERNRTSTNTARTSPGRS